MKVVVKGGTTFTQLLLLLFAALKLTGVINWSWLWVLSPLWVPFAIGAVILVGVLFCLGLRELTK